MYNHGTDRLLKSEGKAASQIGCQATRCGHLKKLSLRQKLVRTRLSWGEIWGETLKQRARKLLYGSWGGIKESAVFGSSPAAASWAQATSTETPRLPTNKPLLL